MGIPLSRKLRRASLILLAICGCAESVHKPVVYPSVAPSTQPVAALQLDSSQISPMYRELLAVDLPAVMHVASARNLDIEQARQRLAVSRGRYESSVEAIFPVIAPTIAFQHIEGVNQSVTGTLVPVNFNTFLPAIAMQWILNPGRVVYDIIASKRRWEASEHQEQAVVQETARTAANQYYDLVLAQARISVARQSLAEAQELSRITQLRVQAGAGLPADDLRAKASMAGYEQDLNVALYNFFQASIALTLTLHLDPTVTLVPQPREITQTTLVREDFSIDEMLATAMEYRPDLEVVRTLMRAAKADSGSTGWGGLGPQVQAGYSYGGLESHTSNQDFSLHEQQKAAIGAGVVLDASVFGRLKTAAANEKLAGLDVDRQIDRVRAAVVSAQQASLTNARIVPTAKQQLEVADEALRLAQANLQVGTMLTLDVLQAQHAVDDARLRYSDAVVHYNQSQINLLAAMGVLDERSLFPETASPSTAPAIGAVDGNAGK